MIWSTKTKSFSLSVRQFRVKVVRIHFLNATCLHKFVRKSFGSFKVDPNEVEIFGIFASEPKSEISRFWSFLFFLTIKLRFVSPLVLRCRAMFEITWLVETGIDEPPRLLEQYYSPAGANPAENG